MALPLIAVQPGTELKAPNGAYHRQLELTTRTDPFTSGSLRLPAAAYGR